MARAAGGNFEEKRSGLVFGIIFGVGEAVNFWEGKMSEGIWWAVWKNKQGYS